MTLAVLLTQPDPAGRLVSADGRSLPEQICDQLRQAGARDVVVVTELTELAELASGVNEPLLICADDLVGHAAVLRHLATQPIPGSVALVLPGVVPVGYAAVGEDRNLLTWAGPGGDPTGEPVGSFGGALRIGVSDLPALAVAARAAATDATVLPAPDRLLTALVRAGARLATYRVRLLVARRVADQAELAAAEAAVAAVDSDAAQLRLAVKEKDDFFTTYAVSTWSPYVTRLVARIGLSPTTVTGISVLFALTAAALFGYGTGRVALVAGGILLYLGFVFDCVDGQLARYTRNFSAWGGWLDTMADRAKEYIVYAGLAVGVERAGLGNGWALAIAAMTLQTVRHMTDTWYGVLHDEAARRPRPATGGGIGERLSRASARVQADTGSVSYWLKRTVVFPIGERWALIALTVALFNPLVSLVAVLVWSSLAFLYTFALRSLRARSMRVPVLATVDTTLHRDDGWYGRLLGGLLGVRWLPGPLPLAVVALLVSGALFGATLAGAASLGWVVPAGFVIVIVGSARSGAAHTGASDWLIPAVLRAAEYLFVIAAGLAGGVPAPLIFGLLLVLALHHYDLTARLEKKEARPPLHAATLGWTGRITVLAIGVVAGVAVLAFGVLVGYLAVVFVLSTLLAWRRPARRPASDFSPEPAPLLIDRS